MNKKYEYNGNIYCEDDLSEEIYNEQIEFVGENE